MNYLVKHSSIIASGEGDFGHVAEDELVLSDARWVPVSERLPDEYVPVMVFTDVHEFARLNRGEWEFRDGARTRDVPVKFWTPLPPGPEGA